MSNIFFKNKSKLTNNIINNTTILKNNTKIIKPLNPLLKNEIFINKKIENIHKNNNYFNTIENYEKILIGALNEENNYLESINLLEKSNYYLINYKNNNYISLDIFLSSLLKKINNEVQNEVQNETLVKEYIFHILDFYKNILYSLDLLINNKIINNNININNIIFSKRNNNIIINSFSHSFYISNNVNNNIHNLKILLKYLFSQENNKENHYPFEFYILNYIQENNLIGLSSNNIDLIYENYINNYAIYKSLFKNNKLNYETFKINNLNYFYKFKIKNYEKLYEEFIKYSDTWDNVSLSSLYLNLIYNLKNLKEFEIIEKNEYLNNLLNNLKDLLIKNISLIPNNPITINNNIELYIELLYY